jgi:hypothetical protein
MSERLYRCQILLDPRQHRRLKEIARRDGRSVSALTRQVIDAGLASLESESEVWKKRNRILDKLRGERKRQSREYRGNLIEGARNEREHDGDRIWKPDT